MNIRINKKAIALVLATKITLLSLGCTGQVVSAAAAVPTQAAVTTTVTNNTPLDLATVNQKIQDSGKFLVVGMNPDKYQQSMSKEKVKVMPTGVKKDITVDLTKRYTYKDLETIITNFAEYDGVEVYIVGKTAEGRNIYSITIDAKSTTLQSNITKPVIMLTGQVHADEFAGSMFILKEFSDLIKNYQTDGYTKLLLQNVCISTIPVVNPDGREQALVSGSTSKKSNVSGVDINRNFPSINAGQLPKGASIVYQIANKPGPAYYPGPTLGSEPETQAVMAWFDQFMNSNSQDITGSIKYKAYCYIDYHQQGRGIYTGKTWDNTISQGGSKTFAQDITKFLNAGKTTRLYNQLYDISSASCDGRGGTTTDYAMSKARGAYYNPEYGILTFGDKPLVAYKSVMNLQNYQAANPDFQSTTIEVTKIEGLGQPLGYSQTARNLMSKEYNNYPFNKLLIHLGEKALGIDKVNELKAQSQKISFSNDPAYVADARSIVLEELLQIRDELSDSNVFENARKKLPSKDDSEELEEKIVSSIRRTM